MQLEPRDADPRHRIVGADLDELAVERERVLAVAAGVGERGAERDHVGMAAIDLVTTLDGRLRILQPAFFQCGEPGVELGVEAILACHEE